MNGSRTAGLVLGIAIGVPIGLAYVNIGLGIGIGTARGIAIGLTIDERRGNLETAPHVAAPLPVNLGKGQ